jgi:two-component system cell cycle sensor histidine kinase/response regulator CckA
MPTAINDARQARTAPGAPALLVAFFVILALGLTGAAYRYYGTQKEAIRHEVGNQLLSIADLKVTEISDWSAQWMDEAGVLMADTAAARAIERLASGTPAQPAAAEVRTWLEEVRSRFHYAGATVVDDRGNTIVSVGRLFGDAGHIRQTAGEVISGNRILFRDLHLDQPANTIHLGLSFPLRVSPDARPFAALLLGIDPGERLYPMLRRWPVASSSGETLLVRREGDEVVFLNDLRFRQGAALRLRMPMSSRENPAVLAVLGAQGVLQGVDYRGVPVLAAVRPVPALPWFLVAKMDTEEVEAPIRRRSALLALATTSLILAAAAAFFAIWRRQQLEFYRARYAADVERQALVGHYDYLSRFANDIILLMDNSGRILDANDRAVTTYGYSRAELMGKTVLDLRHQSCEDDFERHWKEVEERGSLVFECVHQKRDGSPFPVEVSVRLIDVGENRFRQSIIRDITERKALDEKLRRMLDTHSAVIESSASAIVSVTPDFRVTTWNTAAERIFGWTAEEALGAPLRIVPAHRVENARQLHRSVTAGAVISGEPGLGQCKDGRVITLSISAAPLHDPDGLCTGVVLNFLDITDQTRAEEALRRNESLYRATFDQAAVGIYYFSLEGRFLRVNARYCEITGYSQEELLRCRYQDITWPDDLHGSSERLERLLSGEHNTSARNKRYIRKDGSVVWVHATISLLRSDAGDPLHFVGVAEDVTERLRAEAALRASEERFRRLVESAPEGIVVERDLRILYANPAALSLFGAATAAELLGRDVRELASPEERAGVEERSAMVARHAAVPPIERTYLRTDGTPFPVEVSAAPIDYDQQPSALVFLRDIAERRHTEAETRRLEEQLRHAQKMESLGRLAGGVAHDFNNHLTVIAGYCDMLLTSLEPGDGRREEILEIREAGERAGTLTQQLLALSRKQIAERKPLNLNDVVAESGKMLRRLIGDQVEIVTSLDPALATAVADRGQVDQVLMNLVVNARDAMPSGGRIHIATANVDLDQIAPPAHKNAAPGPYVLLCVSDTGVGMDEETLKHIFEPFFTTKGLGIGTGLGLSTVYGVVRQNGGWIEVDSRPGEGSQFRIYLPGVEGVAAAREQVAPQVIPGGAETVLLAEDQPEVRRLALRILKGNGYRLLEAASGPEALAVSRGHEGPIDLLVTDVIMPEMTGRELASRLKESRPQLKVLYVSGYTADVIGREGVLDPGVAYLPKPFTPAQLSIKVREVLGQSKTVGRILLMDGDDAIREVLLQVLSDAGYEVLAAGDGREVMRQVTEQPFDLVLAEESETIRGLRRDYPGMRIVAMSGAMDPKTFEPSGADVTLSKPVDCQELLRIIRDLLA